MKLVYTLGAFAVFAACAAGAGAAMAQEDDGPRNDARDYCYAHPRHERCREYDAERRHRRYDSDCARTSTHAAGKAWIPHFVARNSAIKAWRKEVRIDYGPEYADWNLAENRSIDCGPSGTGFGQVCEARGRPCR
jgi:hypothetical protein